ncbi:MAG: YciI family protein [Bacteroidetes bacterium]|nr:YciI family protein [Bacteroidota bacterium]
MYHILIYHTASDYLERRAAFRDDHLTYARAAYERGELLLAGAFADPPDMALLVFKDTDPAVIEEFARGDVYVRNGVVTSWEVRPWTVVIG